MGNGLKTVLGRLRLLLGGRSERAYADRDAKGATDLEREYAAGEAHAYGVAEMDVRDAEKDAQKA